MLSRRWRAWVDANDSALFAADLLVADAGVMWKARPRPDAEQGEAQLRNAVLVGSVDLYQWKGLLLKLVLAIGQAVVGSAVHMPVLARKEPDQEGCDQWLYVNEWSITKVDRKTTVCDWGGSYACDLVLSSSAAEVERTGVKHELLLRHFQSHPASKSKRTLSVLRSGLSEEPLKCLCCKARRAVFFCPNDHFDEERATCHTCCRALMKSPLAWRTRFSVPEQDMLLLRAKAGRVYQMRGTYTGRDSLFAVRIRVKDVLEFYRTEWREFVCRAQARCCSMSRTRR